MSDNVRLGMGDFKSMSDIERGYGITHICRLQSFRGISETSEHIDTNDPW